MEDVAALFSILVSVGFYTLSCYAALCKVAYLLRRLDKMIPHTERCYLPQIFGDCAACSSDRAEDIPRFAENWVCMNISGCAWNCVDEHAVC